jgi:hypothetical protein
VAGRTAAEAVHNYIGPLQQAISCISDAVLVQDGYSERDDPHTAVLNRGRPVRLQGASPLSIVVVQLYRAFHRPDDPNGAWNVRTVGYYYRLLDADEQGILLYHWHPNERSPIDYPHLHIGVASGVSRDDLRGAHLPTGDVAIADLIRLLIRDFRVTPHRADWAAVLSR